MVRVLREVQSGRIKGDWTLETIELDPDTGNVGSVVAVYPDFIDPIEYQGRTYPRHLRATWTRPDGLEVTMQIETDTDDGPVALGFSVISEKRLRAGDYQFPIPTMAKKAAKSHGFAGAVPETRPARPVLDLDYKVRRWRFVAEIYREAIELGVPVQDRVYNQLQDTEFAVSHHRTAHLIKEARREKDPDTGETFLPPTDPGRKKA